MILNLGGSFIVCCNAWTYLYISLYVEKSLRISGEGVLVFIQNNSCVMIMYWLSCHKVRLWLIVWVHSIIRHSEWGSSSYFYFSILRLADRLQVGEWNLFPTIMHLFISVFSGALLLGESIWLHHKELKSLNPYTHSSSLTVGLKRNHLSAKNMF